MIRLATTDAGFETAFAALVNARRESDAGVSRDVATILRSVRDPGENGGEAAVRAFTLKLDRHDLNDTGWRVEPADCRAS